MHFENDFFIQAQGVIERSFRAKRDDILAGHGSILAELKSDSTPVTILDKELEEELREALTAFDPGIGLYGEEYGQEGNKNTFWLIDPIDGTDNFVRGLDNVRNMVTLIDNEEPVFTMVYKPVTDDMYVAAKGEGTYKNHKPIKMQERELGRALIELSMSLGDPGAASVLQAVDNKIWNFKMGDFLQVPEGKLDGHIVYNGKGDVWDYAPRALLIQEAGGRVANIGSDYYDYRNLSFLAAHPAIFDQLMEIIVEARKAETVIA